MTTERTVELAILAYSSYKADQVNALTLPAGWTRNDSLTKDDTDTGFGATVYTRGSEVVISFRGTDNPKLPQHHWDIHPFLSQMTRFAGSIAPAGGV
jgi:hypothetical protein